METFSPGTREGHVDRVAVSSHDIAIVGYDNRKALLEVAFRSGGVYQYANVPSEIYQSLMTAPSHGSYLRDHVMGKFQHAKIH
jgi:hypothetical protein